MSATQQQKSMPKAGAKTASSSQTVPEAMPAANPLSPHTFSLPLHPKPDAKSPNELPTPPPPPSFPIQSTPPTHFYPPQSELALFSLSIPATNFCIACSPILFVPSTASVVLVYDKPFNRYFLPRGRKDRGESLSDCAIREGYEESGFRGQLVDWGSGAKGTGQPKPPTGKHREVNKEAFWMQAMSFYLHDRLWMYFAYYFIGIVPEDAVSDPDRSRLVGKHEMGYEGVIVPIEKAVRLLCQQKTRKDDDTMVFVPTNKDGDGDNWVDSPLAQGLCKDGKIWREKEGASEVASESNDPLKLQKDGSRKGNEKRSKKQKEEEHDVPSSKSTSSPTLSNDPESFLPDEQVRIESQTAFSLQSQDLGTLIPNPSSGADDSVLQAKIILAAWDRLLEVYGER